MTATFLGTSSLSYFGSSESQAARSILPPHTLSVSLFVFFLFGVINTEYTSHAGTGELLWWQSWFVKVPAGNVWIISLTSYKESKAHISMYLLNNVLFKLKSSNINYIQKWQDGHLRRGEGKKGKIRGKQVKGMFVTWQRKARRNAAWYQIVLFSTFPSLVTNLITLLTFWHLLSTWQMSWMSCQQMRSCIGCHKLLWQLKQTTYTEIGYNQDWSLSSACQIKTLKSVGSFDTNIPFSLNGKLCLEER